MFKTTLQSDLVSAMKAKDEVRVRTIRLVKAAILKYETSAADLEADDAKIIEILRKEVKQRNDSIEQFEKGGRNDLAEAEKLELLVLKSYLPQELSEDQIRDEVKAILTSINAVSKEDFNKAIGKVMGVMKGRADGAIVRKIMEGLLT